MGRCIAGLVEMIIPPFGIGSHSASWRRNSLGKTGPAVPSWAAGETTCLLEMEAVILPGVAGLLDVVAKRTGGRRKCLETQS